MEEDRTFADVDEHLVLADIHDLRGDEAPTVTLATASFPCTDLSLAGKRAGLSGTQSSAFWRSVRVLDGMRERRPPMVMLENVPAFLTSRGGQDCEDALLALAGVRGMPGGQADDLPMEKGAWLRGWRASAGRLHHRGLAGSIGCRDRSGRGRVRIRGRSRLPPRTAGTTDGPDSHGTPHSGDGRPAFHWQSPPSRIASLRLRPVVHRLPGPRCYPHAPTRQPYGAVLEVRLSPTPSPTRSSSRTAPGPRTR
jgi:hypothetical protein